MNLVNRRGLLRAASRAVLEGMEQRRLLTAQINFANFSSTSGLALNGYGSSPTVLNNQLVLTDSDNDGDEARSALDTTAVPIDTFTSHFTFQSDPMVNQADGFTFVIDNGATTDVGGDGQYFGYTGGTFGAHSVALAFDLYNGGQGGTYFGEGQGGTVINANTNATPLDLHNGDLYNFTVTYNGTNLAVSAVDSTNPSLTFSNSTPIDLATVLGGHTAFVGFTGSDGFQQAVQQIGEFDFTGQANSTTTTPSGPSITSVTVNPASVTGTKSTLTATASTTSGGTLTYTWSLAHVPPGAPTPTFSTNHSTSNQTQVHYFKDGTYNFLLTVTDSNGGTTSTVKQVVVQQTPTSIRVAPHKQQITVKHTQQFTGTVVDQFGHALRTSPALTYAIETGGGSINALTGLYTAPTTRGHLLVSVSGDDLTGTAGATVIA